MRPYRSKACLGLECGLLQAVAIGLGRRAPLPHRLLVRFHSGLRDESRAFAISLELGVYLRNFSEVVTRGIKMSLTQRCNAPSRAGELGTAQAGSGALVILVVAKPP